MTIDDALLRSFKKQQSAKKGTADANHRQEDLTQKLMACAKRIPITEIAFVKVEHGKSELKTRMDSLKSKYINLAMDRDGTGGKSASHQLHQQNGSAAPGLLKDAVKSDGIPAPRVILYPTSHLVKKWSGGNTFRNGAGLINSGNTCFLNSVLQSLIYCVPLHHYLLSKHHSKSCKLTGFCMLCELERLAHRLIINPHGAANPSVIIHNLKNIGKNFRFGRQEDAHEFLRHVIESMQKSCLYGLNPKLDRWSKETTLVHQIYGGYLRSQVTCCQCGYKSNTFETSLDICLDICKVVSIQDALKNFTKMEFLTQGNLYDCSKCHRKVQAKKRCTIHRPPLILTLQLKRYNFHMSWKSSKLKTHLFFPSVLDIRPYLSQGQGPPVKYELYSTVVHAGDDCHCGHYYAYVKSPTGQWIEANDARMNVRNRESVLRNPPYILFYQRVDSGSSSSPSPSNASPSPTNSQIHPAPSVQKLENGFQIRRPQPGPSVIAADRPKLKFNFNNSKNGTQAKLIGPVKPGQEQSGSNSTHSPSSAVNQTRWIPHEKKNGVRTPIVPYGSGESSSSSDVDTGAAPTTGKHTHHTNTAVNQNGSPTTAPVDAQIEIATPVTVRKRSHSSQNGVENGGGGSAVKTRVTSTSSSWVPSDGGHAAHNICSDSSLHSNTSNTSMTSTSGWSVTARERHLLGINGHARSIPPVVKSQPGQDQPGCMNAPTVVSAQETTHNHSNNFEVESCKKDEVSTKHGADGSGDRVPSSVQQAGSSQRDRDEEQESRRVRKKRKKHKKRKKEEAEGDCNHLKDAARLEASIDHKAGKIKIKIRRSSDSDSEENLKSTKERKGKKNRKHQSSDGNSIDTPSTKRDHHDNSDEREEKRSKIDKKKSRRRRRSSTDCEDSGQRSADTKVSKVKPNDDVVGNDSDADLGSGIDKSLSRDKDTHSTAVVKSWDHHVRDTLHRKKRKHIDHDDRYSSSTDHTDSRYSKKHKSHSDSDFKTKINSSMNDVIDHIHSRKYSYQVESWDGDKSQVDGDEDRRRSAEAKRKYDYWDSEIDSGKTKKKKNKSHRNDHHFRYNQFQKFQNSMNSTRPFKR